MQLPGQTIRRVERRAKYLLLRADIGTAILHLGMTAGCASSLPAHRCRSTIMLDLVLASGRCLRFNDSRRFGALLWTRNRRNGTRSSSHSDRNRWAMRFPAPIFITAQGRIPAIKAFIMDNHMVVGVGKHLRQRSAVRRRDQPVAAGWPDERGRI